MAYGELLAAKYLTAKLSEKGLSTEFVDARKLIITDTNFGNAQPIDSTSKKMFKSFLKTTSISVVTGFIGATTFGETTTLGRNGSNYTASLLANYLNAAEFQNFTHVDGIFTANPELVEDARKIERLSFNETNELGQFWCYYSSC